MASDNKINIPGSSGGIMRYDEEYGSKFMLSPNHVFVYIVLVLLFVFALNIFFK